MNSSSSSSLSLSHPTITRFKYEEETELYCICGQRQTQLHPFSWLLGRAHRALLQCNRSHRQLRPEEVLETPEGVAVFAEWAPAIGLFKRCHKGVGRGEEEEVLK